MAKAAGKKVAVKKVTVKKAVVKKSSAAKTAVKSAKAEQPKEKKTLHVKYDDKSAGQPELVQIFDAIRKLMEPYDKKRSLVIHADKPSQAHLVSHKPVEIDGRKKDELWFVSAMIQKGYVGFYYMPIYTAGELKKEFSETFVKSLKGKTCFHIKQNTPEIMADIKKAIRVGYEAFVDKGWL